MLVVSVGRGVGSYDAGEQDAPRTHPALAVRSIELAASDQNYNELGVDAYKTAVADAVIDEDTPPRYVNHFYNPSNASGLSETFYSWFWAVYKGGTGQLQPHFQSALDWGRDGMGDGLDWKGAIETYDYTPLSKLRAYRAVGHVLHLIQDMAQPDHTRNRAHPCNDLSKSNTDIVGYEELWSRRSLNGTASWPKGTHVQKFSTFEKFFTNLAYESQQQEDNLDLPRAAEELALGCGPPTLVQWGKIAPARGVLQPANLIRIILQHGFDALSDAHWQEAELTLPVSPTIPISPSDPINEAYTKLGKIMLPKAEEYGAGLLQFFHDIVNQPPFVEEVQMFQKGQRRYRKWWEDQINGGRVVARQPKTEGDGILDPDVEATLYVWFGPHQESESLSIARKNIAPAPTVALVPDGGSSEEGPRITLDPQGPEFGPNPEKGPFWMGTFTPTRGTTLRIQAADLGGHYKDDQGQREQSLTPVGGKRGAQGELDSDPSTPARATWRESKADDKAPAGAPYPWKGYEAGPDTNHHFTVKGGVCPILSQMRWAKWTVRYTRTDTDHEKTVVLKEAYCHGAILSEDPDKYRPCSRTRTEHARSDGYVFSAWPYPAAQGGGEDICFRGCSTMVRVHFPWSQIPPNDLSEIRFGRWQMDDATVSGTFDSTCGSPECGKLEPHKDTTRTERIMPKMGAPTKCDLSSLDSVRHVRTPETDRGWTEQKEEFDYSFAVSEAPPHFLFVEPITFNYDDLMEALRRAIAAVTTVRPQGCANIQSPKACYEAFAGASRPIIQLLGVLQNDAENQWRELTNSFAAADRVWWQPQAGDYENKVAQVKVAASAWQALASTIPQHLATSVDNQAQAIQKWDSQAADELHAIAQKLRSKGLDLTGAH